MSNKYANMSQHAMLDEAKRLMPLVQKVDVPQQVQQLILTACDKAFAKTDDCPNGTDIVYMPDVSGSMMNEGGWGWKTQLAIAQGVVPKSMAYDEGGIDIYPIRNTSELEKMSKPWLYSKLRVTNSEEALTYLKRFERCLGTTPTRELFAERMVEVVKRAIADPNTKRTLFLISTDGSPDPYHTTMEATTENAIMALRKAGLEPRRYIAISYLIITPNFPIMCGYLKLEDRNIWGPEGTNYECDIANAMFPVLITALGGFDNPLAIAIALAGAISDEIDKSLELILTGPAKDLMDLMHAYIDARYLTEVY